MAKVSQLNDHFERVRGRDRYNDVAQPTPPIDQKCIRKAIELLSGR